MIYLASPYSDPDANIREQRFRAACRAAARLLRAGHAVFCPVAHSHCIAAHGLPAGWSFWERIDREHLERCGEIVVLLLDGWLMSEGVRAEMRLAVELGKPIRFLVPTGGDDSPTLARVAEGGGV